MNKLPIKYYGKFNGEIPISFKKLIEQDKHKILYDPFCGSGTTFFTMDKYFDEVILNDINSIVIRFLKNIKHFSEIDFDIFSKKVQEVSKNKISNKLQEMHPNFKELQKWFSNNNLNQMILIWNSASYFSKTEYELLLLLTASLLKKVVNKRQVWNVGYISDNVKPNIENKSNIFNLINNQIIKIKDEWNKNQNRNFNNLRVTKIDLVRKEIDYHYDFIITSPPYPFAVDYTRNLRLEYLFLNENFENDFNKEVGARGKRSPISALDVFFHDMEKMYLNIIKKLSINGIFCMSISNTKRKGKEIDFVEWTKKLFFKNNLELIYDKKRYLKQQATPNKKIKYERLLAFKKL